MEAAPYSTRETIDGAWYQRVNGLHVLEVSGSFYEMGYQHGHFLKDIIPEGAVPFFNQYLRRQLGGKIFGPLAPAIWQQVSNSLATKVAKGLPSFAKETLRGIADGAGLSYEFLERAMVMPDSLMWVASRTLQMRIPQLAVRNQIPIEMGCSSAIARPDATVEGRLLHGRNFDYYGLEPWTNGASVIFHRPAQGQRYASVTTAGVPFGGITAMNEAGLSLAVHQHLFTRLVRFGGTPIGLTGDDIMRKAESVHDAKTILDAQRSIGCWTYNITDGKTGEVLCYEQTPHKSVGHILDRETWFAYANSFIDGELAAQEMNVNAAYWRTNTARYQRLGTLLRKHQGHVTPEVMANILGDCGQDCRLSGAVAVLHTVGSTIFDPKVRHMWVATGRVPVSTNRFVAFDLMADDPILPQGKAIGSQVAEEDPNRLAFNYFRDAHLAYTEKKDVTTSYRLMVQACQHAPDQSLFHIVTASLAVKGCEPKRARESCEVAIRLGHREDARLPLFYLVRGFTYDLEGHRQNALRDYVHLESLNSDQSLLKMAQRYRKRAFSQKDARRLSIDFANAVVR